MTPVFEDAIKNNNHEYIRKGLNHQWQSVPANSANAALQTGLMIACKHKSLETVKAFLKKSTAVKNDDPSFCNVNLVDTSGWTALHYAAQSGTWECVKLLIENKANTNSVNEGLQTGLMIACQHKSFETVKVLLKKSTPVKHEDPSFCNVNLVDAACWTALHYASQSGSFECVELLIEHKAEVDATTDNIETPLHFAAQNNFYDIVKLLIDNKADIDATTDKNETALFLATKHNHFKIVEFLAEKNCKLQTKALFKKPVKYSFETQKEITALEVAVQHNFVEISKCLIFHYLDSTKSKASYPKSSDYRKAKKITGLEIAIAKNIVEIGRCLLFPLLKKEELHEEELSELLIEAAKNGHTHIANELLVNGANINHEEGKISNYSNCNYTLYY